MGFWDSLKTGFPYSNLHSLNLDWILNEVSRLRKEGLTLLDIAQSIANINQRLNSAEQELETVSAIASTANTLSVRNTNDISSLRGTDAQTAKNADALGDKPPEAFTAVNLLDNSDFSKPVNQRGLPSYNGIGYCIDRWAKESNGVLRIDGNYITIDNSANAEDEVIIQKVEASEAAKLLGKSVTMCVCLADGTVHVNSGTVVNDTSTARIITDSFEAELKFFTSANNYQTARLTVFAGQSVSIKWIALYVGEYTAETFPAYVPKGYSAELLVCQRYGFPLSGQPVYGFLWGSGSLYLAVPLQTNLRVVPSLNGTLRVNIVHAGSQKIVRNVNASSVATGTLELLVNSGDHDLGNSPVTVAGYISTADYASADL